MYGRGVLEDSVQDPARPGATIRLVIAEVVAPVVAPALVLCALGVVPRVIHPVAAWAGARTWATGALTPVRTALRARHVTRGAHLLLVGVAVDRLGEEALERTAARRNTGSGVHILRSRGGYRGLLSGQCGHNVRVVKVLVVIPIIPILLRIAIFIVNVKAEAVG
jgi:hypothetical protein